MKRTYQEIACDLGVAPLQVLVELAAMNQPWEECWPVCDEGFTSTIRERRRLRFGLAPVRPGTSAPRGLGALSDGKLPVSPEAAAILHKLVAKGYGLKRVRLFTLTRKWVHGTTEEHVRELVRRGNLEWSDPDRTAVNLVADKMPDTERIIDLYRGVAGR